LSRIYFEYLNQFLDPFVLPLLFLMTKVSMSSVALGKVLVFVLVLVGGAHIQPRLERLEQNLALVLLVVP
jgi:hypothetical protein